MKYLRLIVQLWAVEVVIPFQVQCMVQHAKQQNGVVRDAQEKHFSEALTQAIFRRECILGEWIEWNQEWRMKHTRSIPQYQSIQENLSATTFIWRSLALSREEERNWSQWTGKCGGEAYSVGKQCATEHVSRNVRFSNSKACDCEQWFISVLGIVFEQCKN
jgi:hypothetical protein